MIVECGGGRKCWIEAVVINVVDATSKRHGTEETKLVAKEREQED